MYLFEIVGGNLYVDGAQFLAKCYSGHGPGLNNPAYEATHDVGPIPEGAWKIEPPYTHPQLGPVTMNLTPWPATDTHGRDAFRIHGDNSKGDQSASHGCIIAPRTAREAIAARLAVDNVLIVTSGLMDEDPLTDKQAAD